MFQLLELKVIPDLEPVLKAEVIRGQALIQLQEPAATIQNQEL